MAEPCVCGTEMRTTVEQGFRFCPHCDDTACPNGLKLSLTRSGCRHCAALVDSLNAA